MKILMLGNQARSMAVFWRVLIEAMRERGAEVVCCVPPGDSESEARLSGFGARVVNYALERKGLNPIRDFRTFLDLQKIMNSERPDCLFATTIKPVIYGCQAAWSAGVPKIFATITGLGYAFEADSLFKKIVNRVARFMYRTSLAHASGIFFQNEDDAALFRAQEIISPASQILHAAGTGVDTRHFAEMPLPASDAPITFLLVGRLLEAKGIGDYAKAAAILKPEWPNARFQLLGAPESGPGSLDLSRLPEENCLEYLGQTDDVRPLLAQAHVVVLPSWREGLPTALMEAMSVGRPLVASNVPGCREVVSEGKTGFFCEARNPDSLARAMEKFLENPDLISKMGGEARTMAVAKFDAHVVANKILLDMGV